MSTLNKVLAILNVVVAAILCLPLAGLDYGKRQAWMFAVLREDFVLKGLPVDDNEKDAEGKKRSFHGVTPSADGPIAANLTRIRH